MSVDKNDNQCPTCGSMRSVDIRSRYVFTDVLGGCGRQTSVIEADVGGRAPYTEVGLCACVKCGTVYIPSKHLRNIQKLVTGIKEVAK
jgi:hypothetical protein